MENPDRSKRLHRKSYDKTDKNDKATWRFTAKNILDFAWAADKDYSVETFIVPDGPKVNFVYQKSEKTQFWERS